MLTGGCHCGAVRYEIGGALVHHSFCHCSDCRRCAGAPSVAWVGVAKEGLRIIGTPRLYRSSQGTERYFCGTCGTGLFYINEQVLPGEIDVQTATLDQPEATAPQFHVQVAERIGWMKTAHELPEFERYPG